MSIQAIITDIEGTITDINFVHRVLFPYSRNNIGSFLKTHYHNPAIAYEIQQTRAMMKHPDATLEAVIAQLIAWIDADQKVTPLKMLQGFIWKYGFETGEFRGHIYQDAYDHLKRWHEAGIKLYIYSSGSVQAQQLFCRYSLFGDIRSLFSGYFDTLVGPKKSAESYQTILKEINREGHETLFLSDVIAELDAARANQIHTCLLNRNNAVHESTTHPICVSFDDIDLANLTS